VSTIPTASADDEGEAEPVDDERGADGDHDQRHHGQVESHPAFVSDGMLLCQLPAILRRRAESNIRGNGAT